jgi:phosphocarrier protein HPr
MISRTVTVASASGLHARPAAIFVKAAAAAPVKVRISANGKKPANAGSMLGVLALGAEKGTEVTLETDDDTPESNAALDELAAMLGRDLDAEADA